MSLKKHLPDILSQYSTQATKTGRWERDKFLGNYGGVTGLKRLEDAFSSGEVPRNIKASTIHLTHLLWLKDRGEFSEQQFAEFVKETEK